MIRQKFPKSVESCRVRLGLTQRAIGSITGLPPSTVSQVERDIHISPISAKKICDALGKNFDDLFEIVNEELK